MSIFWFIWPLIDLLSYLDSFVVPRPWTKESAVSYFSGSRPRFSPLACLGFACSNFAKKIERLLAVTLAAIFVSSRSGKSLGLFQKFLPFIWILFDFLYDDVLHGKNKHWSILQESLLNLPISLPFSSWALVAITFPCDILSWLADPGSKGWGKHCRV